MRKKETHRIIVGKYSLHETTTENGLLLIDFAREKKKYATLEKGYKRGNMEKPDGKHNNHMDHVPMEKGQEKVVIKIRSYRRLVANTDHTMVGFKRNLSKPENTKQKTWKKKIEKNKITKRTK